MAGGRGGVGIEHRSADGWRRRGRGTPGSQERRHSGADGRHGRPLQPSSRLAPERWEQRDGATQPESGRRNRGRGLASGNGSKGSAARAQLGRAGAVEGSVARRSEDRASSPIVTAGRRSSPPQHHPSFSSSGCRCSRPPCCGVFGELKSRPVRFRAGSEALQLSSQRKGAEAPRRKVLPLIPILNDRD